MRIDFPAKSYKQYTTDCNFSFEYPDYSVVERVETKSENSCWYNISAPAYNAKIHLTYRKLNKNLSVYSEDIRQLAYKHIVKADDIVETKVNNPENKVYGLVYSISGNTATALSFYLTDSVSNFLSGALYFAVAPNADSLAPAIQFFREDVVHLTETLVWN